MRIVITGATGFVGRYVVAAALGRDHQVRAVVRPSSDAGTLATLLDARHGLPLGTSEADLRSPEGLDDLVEGADAVIHLAAAKSGDFYTQFAGTVVSTENLLAAMTAAGVPNLVAVSTFSVYDMLAMKTGALLDEASPIDTSPERRDEYAQTKLLQEDLYRQFSDTDENRAVIVRPGMIYGRDNLWHALLGADVGPRFVKIGSKATLPLSYVENAAEALVLAAEHLNTGDPADDANRVVGEVINLVDDNLPTQASYIERVSAVIEPPPSIGVPWGVARLAAGTLAKANDVLVGGRAKFPGIVVPDRLHARFKPLRYTNAKAKRLLGWSPRYSLSDAIARSASNDDLLLVTALNRDPTTTATAPAPDPAPRPRPVSQPAPEAARRPPARPVPQPEHRPAPSPTPEAEHRPTPQPSHRPMPNPAPEPEHRPAAQPEHQPPPQPEHRPQTSQPSPAPQPGAPPPRSMLEELLRQPVEHPKPSDEEEGQ